MAGHNKWSKIKRQKAAEDKKKSKIWARLSREITVAAREGGGDAEMNATLANAIESAKAENMAKDTIERAIKKGTGELEGEEYEEVTYEGYGPAGVAFFVESVTDNTNRTVADLRHVFGKAGGSLGKSGSVGYLFDRKGRFEIPSDSQDELALFEHVVEAGAEDLIQKNGSFVVTTPVDRFDDVEASLDRADIKAEKAALVRTPLTTVQLDASDAEKVQRLIEDLEDLDDVQNVFTTLEVDGEPLAVMAE